MEGRPKVVESAQSDVKLSITLAYVVHSTYNKPRVERARDQSAPKVRD